MADTMCHNCGGEKPADRYRACPSCRAAWRIASRKPGGTAEKIDAATDAIAYLLGRSQRDDRLYYHIGYGTEAFRRLTKAYAVLTGQRPEDVEARYVR